MRTNVIPALILGALKQRGWTQSELAMRTDLTPKHISHLVHGKDGVSVDVALRLELALGIPARLLIELQSDIDLKKARAKRRKGVKP